MYLLRTIRDWGWSLLVLGALAILALVFEWPLWILATTVAIVIVLSLFSGVTSARQKDLSLSLWDLRQLVGHFNRRFLGDSPIAIFAVINSLLDTENQEIWNWARTCDMSRRVLTAWGQSFHTRMENDVRTRRFDLHTYLNELWLLNNQYYEFVVQLYEVARKTSLSPETRQLYQRFLTEYNAFAQNFRENLSKLKKVSQTGIEPPSVNMAKELPVAK
ncbi:MAG: hypothetical protein WC369_00845 [Dehalococcoidales bacterium]|jgi:hypothetical protein